MPTGDRPIFPLPKQRLDKVDVEDITNLVQETILRTIGSILGPCEGFLSEVEFRYEAPFLYISECRLAYSRYVSGSTLVTDGGVVTFRPALHNNGGRVDLSPLDGASGYLFFKRSETSMDEENRAFFDVVSQTKKVDATNTRMREQVVWAVSTNLTTYTSADGWGLAAKLQSGGGTYGAIPYAAGEMRDISGVPQNVLRSIGDGGLGVPWRQDTATLAAQSPVGIFRYLQHIIGSLQHIYDRTFTMDDLGRTTGSVNAVYPNRWTLTTLARDINELHTDLAAVEAAVGQGVAAVINVSFNNTTKEWYFTDPSKDYIGNGLLAAASSLTTTNGAGVAVCSLVMTFAAGWIITGWRAQVNYAPLQAFDVQVKTFAERLITGCTVQLPVATSLTTIEFHVKQRASEPDTSAPPPYPTVEISSGPYQSAIPMTFVIYGHRA